MQNQYIHQRLEIHLVQACFWYQTDVRSIYSYSETLTITIIFLLLICIHTKHIFPSWYFTEHPLQIDKDCVQHLNAKYFRGHIIYFLSF